MLPGRDQKTGNAIASILLTGGFYKKNLYDRTGNDPCFSLVACRKKKDTPLHGENEKAGAYAPATYHKTVTYFVTFFFILSAAS